jgi:hypothetical protein
MSTEIIDRLPVKQLIENCEIKRATFYQRVKALGIKFEQNGRESYASAAQIKLLNNYNIAIARGEGDKFLKNHLTESSGKYDVSSNGIAKGNAAVTQQSLGDLVTTEPFAQAELMAAIVHRLMPPVDLLLPQRSLQEAADNRWILSSAQVTALIGTKGKGQSFMRYGFKFDRAGRGWWAVSNAHTSAHDRFPGSHPNNSFHAQQQSGPSSGI